MDYDRKDRERAKSSQVLWAKKKHDYHDDGDGKNEIITTKYFSNSFFYYLHHIINI